jgi:hypothetical protein
MRSTTSSDGLLVRVGVPVLDDYLQFVMDYVQLHFDGPRGTRPSSTATSCQP